MGVLRFKMHARMPLFVSAEIHEFLGIFFEFRQAMLAAEKISLPVVIVFSCSRARLYVHAANWINHVLSLPQNLNDRDVDHEFRTPGIP